MDLYTIQNLLAQGKSIFELPLRCTFYARVSTDKEEQQNSLTNQITYYSNFIANHKNWSCADGYVDDGISGMSAEKRPDFIRMIKDAKTGKFDLVLTKEISRFARNTVDSIQYTRELLKYGVGVYFQNDNINTLMPDAELRLTIMSSIAQEEIRKMSERIRFGHKKAIEDGKVLGNGQMWGYEKVDGKLVIVESKARMVRALFQLYSEGKGFRTVSRLLYDMGYTSKSGGPVSYSTLRYMIENPKYKGVYAGGKSVTVDYRTKQRKFLSKDRWVIREEAENIPPIVDDSLWQKANDILLRRSHKYSTAGKAVCEKYPYSGLVYCGVHQKPFWRTTMRKTGETKEAWQCSLYRQKGRKGCDSITVFRQELDLAVGYAVKDSCPRFLLLIHRLLILYRYLLEENGRTAVTVNLEKDTEKLRAKMMRLIDLAVEDETADHIIKNKIKSLDEQIIALQKQKREKVYDPAEEITQIKAYLSGVFDDEYFCEISAGRIISRITVNSDANRLEILRHDNTVVCLQRGESKKIHTHGVNFIDNQ